MRQRYTEREGERETETEREIQTDEKKCSRSLTVQSQLFN